MRIYLDTCVFQDLKDEVNKDFLASIIKNKGKFIYCFSEAHIQDLSRDKTDEKFSDMSFMETIVDDNCFFYEKRFIVSYYTPLNFYNRFGWPSVYSANKLITDFSNDEASGGLLKTLLTGMPLKFQILNSQHLPNDMPQDLVDMLFKPSNMYEFMLAMTDYSDALTERQGKFKEQLQYLHKNSLEPKNLDLIGIEGCDGQKITDKEKFRSSYANYFLKDTKGKNRYDLFINMYNGLELFGFVQGKPRKQKMMNMINDGRHAFFGGHCDIVVSKDEDFINKTKFMYDLYEVQTQVYNIFEFSEYLRYYSQNNSYGFFDLINEIKNETLSNIVCDIKEDGQRVIFRKLDHMYMGYFNICISHSNGNIYFTKDITNLMEGTLIKEIEFCVNQLFQELGEDIYMRGQWITNELKREQEKEWHGRTWVMNDIVIDLKFTDRLYIILSEL